jgi:transposase
MYILSMNLWCYGFIAQVCTRTAMTSNSKLEYTVQYNIQYLQIPRRQSVRLKLSLNNSFTDLSNLLISDCP